MRVVLVPFVTGLAIGAAVAFAGAYSTVRRHALRVAEAEDKAERATIERKDIMHLAAGGWTFKPPVPYTPAEQERRRLKYLEEIYAESLRGRDRAIRGHAYSVRNWDRQVQELSSKLAEVRNNLARLEGEE